MVGVQVTGELWCEGVVVSALWFRFNMSDGVSDVSRKAPALAFVERVFCEALTPVTDIC
jgi:hypothetical protein